MIEDYSFWLFAFAWFLAGFVNSVGGMGAAMVALPIVAGAMHAQTLVPATCLCVAIISAAMSWVYWRSTRWQSLKAMIAGALPGSLAGLGILLILPTSVLQLAAGTIMILFVLWQFLHKAGAPHGDSGTAGATAGFFSGFINTSIGFGNPPVAIYSIYAGWEKMETMGSMNVFTLIVCGMTIAAHAGAGLYSEEVFRYALFGGPATVIGMIAGLPIARRINQATFKRILLLIIGAAGCICVFRGLGQLLGS
ncbi:MAG: sulfite exporter TauE/SafE family protein [Desulfovibrionaceae bacterium]|nr:sulfite exporter TauE/SafE family protein [Desulfovibrionaceae bacterium]